MKNDLRFSGETPVGISKNGDVSDIFNPIRSANCDISIVTNKLLTDLYINDRKGIICKVEEVNTDKTLFEGYITPNTYSQYISPNLDNMDITAIDPIALLKYIYIDDVLERSKTVSFGELLARSISKIKIDSNTLCIEDIVSYKGGYNFIDFKIQTNNFWDEGEEPSDLHTVISECLRLFGLCLSFTGEKYIIFSLLTDHNQSSHRGFTEYRVEDGGSLVKTGNYSVDMRDMLFRYSLGDWTAINDYPTLSINDVYDKIDCVASTKIPNYTKSVFDEISSKDTDKYDAADVNIQCNKTNGYNEDDEKVEDDEWYYIWNGVYTSDEYGLKLKNGSITGYANINAAQTYINGQPNQPNISGSIVNFYGGENNLVGTSKDPQTERAVEVKNCITVFAPDNGTPPEFLERTDLKWTYRDTEIEDSYREDSDVILTKLNNTDSKFGINKAMPVFDVSYKQTYENITISQDATQTICIDLSQCYSRTGVNEVLNIPNYTDIEGRMFRLLPSDIDDVSDFKLVGGTAYTYPKSWNPDFITVKNGFFDRFAASDTRLKEVWDKRMILLYITTNGKTHQFNGKDWIEVDAPSGGHAFWLKKLMNGEKIFATEFRYNLIETNDGETYSFDEEGFTYHISNGGVVEEGGEEKTFEYYADKKNVWSKYIEKVGEGVLDINLPFINSVNTNVYIEIYNSSLLGITGNTTTSVATRVDGEDTNMYGSKIHELKYEVSGTVEVVNEETGVVIGKTPLTAEMIDNPDKNVYRYGKILSKKVFITWQPLNVTYIKAEHLNINLSISVPQSNLGQMFNESDIEYSTDNSKKLKLSYDAPNFLVNTKHNIVSQSHSYLIVGNEIADPHKFLIGGKVSKLDNVAARPENYVLQAYKNFYNNIRYIYDRTLIPHKEGLDNIMCYVEANDIPDKGKGRWLMVVSDYIDVKTNRHSIVAVEDYDISVKKIDNYSIVEIPRQPRNMRYLIPNYLMLKNKMQYK